MDGLEEDATSCMRIVTWNCQGGFRHKADKIAALEPDIAIIQECEAPDRLPAHDAGWSQRPLCWHGDNPRGKGVAVFASFGNQLTIDPIHDPSIKYVVPVVVAGPSSFNLLAVWTKEDDDKKAMYIGQALAGVNAYASFIEGGPTMVVGDFNSNLIWDRPDNHRHADVVAALDGHGLVSIYHHWYQERQGAESRNTFYMYRTPDRGFHIDYCFIPRSWLPYVRGVQVGAHEAWSDLSDHCPLIVDIDFDRPVNNVRQRVLRWRDQLMKPA